MTIRKILLAAALAASAAGAHAAVTYDATGGLTSTEPGPVVTNTFDDGMLPTGFATYDLTPGGLRVAFPSTLPDVKKPAFAGFLCWPDEQADPGGS